MSSRQKSLYCALLNTVLWPAVQWGGWNIVSREHGMTEETGVVTGGENQQVHSGPGYSSEEAFEELAGQCAG